MAVPANTAQVYQSTVRKEDLSSIAELIAPTETPFMTRDRQGHREFHLQRVGDGRSGSR